MSLQVYHPLWVVLGLIVQLLLHTGFVQAYFLHPPRCLPRQTRRHRQTAVFFPYNTLQTRQYFPKQKREREGKNRTDLQINLFSPKVTNVHCILPLPLKTVPIPYTKVKCKHLMSASV